MPDESDLTYHLLRGSPIVRLWSKYQKTIPLWTLCGIRRKARHAQLMPLASEFDATVTCRYCKSLMATPAKMPASPAEPQEKHDNGRRKDPSQPLRSPSRTTSA